jgi:hypothetical protein
MGVMPKSLQVSAKMLVDLCLLRRIKYPGIDRKAASESITRASRPRLRT